MQYLDKREVGQRIRSLRKKRKMTQQELSDKLNYSTERQLQRIERGETGCSVDKLMEIAQVLDVSTDYLLFGEGLDSQEENSIFDGLLKERTGAEYVFVYRLVKAILECMQDIF